MIRHITVCFAFFALLLAAQEADESYNITKQTFPYVVTIRVKTMTEKSAKINNPVRWLPLGELVPDGTLVKKDQVIARFNTEYTQFELDSQLLEEAVIDANLQRRLANIENNNIDMDDQMGELDDKLKTAEAKLARLLRQGAGPFQTRHDFPRRIGRGRRDASAEPNQEALRGSRTSDHERAL